MRRRLKLACAHTPWSGRPGSSYRPGVLNSCYPSPRSSHPRGPWIDPRGRQRNLRKSSGKREKTSYSTPGLGVWRLSKPLP